VTPVTVLIESVMLFNGAGGLDRSSTQAPGNSLFSGEVHPVAEIGADSVRGLLLVCLVRIVPAEVGFELGRGFVAERRIQALGVMDG
jgi:hypothetical protein